MRSGWDECCAGIRENELSQLHPSHSNDLVGDLLYGPALTLHDDHFKAIIVIKMNVSCSQYHGPGVVLGLGQFLGKIGYMVVVDQGKRADDRFIGVDGFCKKRLANQVAHSL